MKKRPSFAAKIVEDSEDIGYFGPSGAGGGFSDPTGIWWHDSDRKAEHSESSYVTKRTGTSVVTFDDGRPPVTTEHHENHCPKCAVLVTSYESRKYHEELAEDGRSIGYYYTCAKCEQLLEWHRYGDNSDFFGPPVVLMLDPEKLNKTKPKTKKHRS